MSNFIQITPFMHVDTSKPLLKFFTDILGFEVQWFRSARLRLRPSRNRRASACWNKPAPTARRPVLAASPTTLTCAMLTQLYAELKPKLDTLPPADVMAPSDQALTGQRELLVAGAGWKSYRFRTGHRTTRKTS